MSLKLQSTWLCPAPGEAAASRRAPAPMGWVLAAVSGNAILQEKSLYDFTVTVFLWPSGILSPLIFEILYLIVFVFHRIAQVGRFP